MKKLMMSTMILIASVLATSAASAQTEDAPLAITKLADGRQVLSMDGLTVYTFDMDQGNISSCYDACAKAWPPVVVAADAVLGASMGLTTRNDGTQQLTYDGMPIYFFAGDGAPGDINGDGLGGVWHIIVE